MRVVFLHDYDCPMGENGQRAYWEAREALSMTPPEARATSQDRINLAIAEFNLEETHVCTCGADRAAEKWRQRHPEDMVRDEVRH